MAYNGHCCWNCWNVALWMGNDEGLYRFALDCRRQFPRNLQKAAEMFMGEVGRTTPDGAKFTLRAVKAAMRGLE